MCAIYHFRLLLLLDITVYVYISHFLYINITEIQLPHLHAMMLHLSMDAVVTSPIPVVLSRRSKDLCLSKSTFRPVRQIYFDFVLNCKI